MSRFSFPDAQSCDFIFAKAFEGFTQTKSLTVRRAPRSADGIYTQFSPANVLVKLFMFPLRFKNI